jgi:hypothetical protein
MIAESVALSLALAAAPTDVRTVSAPDSPVRLAHATALSGADGPPVVLYEASNPGDDQLDEFTVIVYVFRDGVLKARQTAPGRRTLDAHGAKYSAIVLDGIPILPTDLIVIGVNQAQKVGSDVWWRADLQEAAEAEAKRARSPAPRP